MNKKLSTIILICVVVVALGVTLIFAVDWASLGGGQSIDNRQSTIDNYAEQNADGDEVSGDNDTNVGEDTDTPQDETSDTSPPANNHVPAAPNDTTMQMDFPVVNVSVIGVDGVIISNMDVPILGDGMTAYHALTIAAGFRGVDIRSRGNGPNVYVAAIDGLAEFGHGPNSGWVFYVNDTRAPRGAGATTIDEGDTIVWRFTVDGR